MSLIQGLITSSTEERKKVRLTLSSIETNIKTLLKMPTNAHADRVEASAQEEEKERRENEKKERHRARNRHEEMSPEQIAADRARHQRGNMSPVNVCRVQARDAGRKESFLPVEQQWDLLHPLRSMFVLLL